MNNNLHFVIPAKAGIQVNFRLNNEDRLDSLPPARELNMFAGEGLEVAPIYIRRTKSSEPFPKPASE